MGVLALFIMKLFRIAPTNWGMVRRRIAYIPKGIFIHYPIATSAAIRGERIIGWVVHYLIGISYAARVHSVNNHSIFALGLYLSGLAVNHAYAL